MQKVIIDPLSRNLSVRGPNQKVPMRSIFNDEWKVEIAHKSIHQSLEGNHSNKCEWSRKKEHFAVTVAEEDEENDIDYMIV